MQAKYKLLLSIGVTSVVLDQLTKVWIRLNLPEGGVPIDVIHGFFRIVHAENPGAAWGILREAAWRVPFFAVTTLIAFWVIGSYYRRLPEGDRLQATGLALILGGAVGNFIDRMIYQTVTDFLEFYVSKEPIATWLVHNIGSNRWPAFNVADISIVVGIGLILFYIFFIEPRVLQQEAAQADPSPGGG